jgi:hypothetical protein
MFKGPNFVYNHIFNKHLNLIQDYVDKEFYDNLKFQTYVKDPHKIYEKYYTVTNMDEYLKYLNSMKNVHHYENESSGYQSKKHHHHHHNNRSGDYKKRRPRDFKDLDDVDTSQQQQTNQKRRLISYDDL